MGYFSDLDVQLRESPTIRLQPHGEPRLPPCPICSGEQAILSYGGGKSVEVFCCAQACAGYDQSHWTTAK